MYKSRLKFSDNDAAVGSAAPRVFNPACEPGSFVARLS